MRALGIRTGDFDGDARRAVLLDACHGAVHEGAGWRLLLVEIHVPGGPLRRMVARNRQPNGRGEQFAVDQLIEDARDVAVVVERHAIAVVLERGRRRVGHTAATAASEAPHVHLERGGHGLRRGLDVVNRVAHRGRLGQKQHLVAFHLRGDLLAVGTRHAHAFSSGGQCDRGLDHIFALDVQRVVNHDGGPFGLRVESRCHILRSIGEDAGELIHRDHIVIPGELVGPRRGGARGGVVEVAAHHERPGVVEPLLRIRPADRSQAAATEAFSAASASSSFLRFQRLW